MKYISEYASPLGRILLSADDIGLTGLWFEGQKYEDVYLRGEHITADTHTIRLAKNWLDSYFSGKDPDIDVPLHLMGTPFQKEVWELLGHIGCGQTVTYGELAAAVAQRRGIPKMSAQAVGGAVGRNPVSIIVPCHRVVGADGSLTGYAGGIRRKEELLKTEHVRLPVPKAK